MAYSSITYTADGSTRLFAVPFKFISRAHVEVRVEQSALTPGVGYSWLSDSSLQLAVAPASGLTINIRRNTPKDARMVDFQDGSVLTEEVLDMDANQSFFVVQEGWDRADDVIANAEAVIAAGDQVQQYAELSYKYERLAYDHMQNTSDSEDRARMYKELAGGFAEATETAAVTIENARAEVSTNTGLVESATSDVLIARDMVVSQAALAGTILQDAQDAASQAQTVANDALATASAAQAAAESVEASVVVVAGQQGAALAAKTDAETARDLAISAKTAAESARDLAAASKTSAEAAEASAGNHATSATASASAASTSAQAATDAKTAAETARDQAEDFASSIDVSTKADLSYVDTQLGTKEAANANIQAHIASTANPHGVTAAQAGAMATSHAANAITGLGASGTATTVSRSDHTHNYQAPIGTISGVVKGNGTDSLTAAVAGTDYVAPGTATTFTKPQRPSMSAETAPSSGAVTWDLTSDSIFRINLSAAITTFNLTGTLSSLVGNQYEALVRFNGGSAITWPSACKFTAGSPPTLTGISGKVDIVTFVVASTDGTNYYLLNTGFKPNVG